ncbi:HHLA1 protein, partial [Grallaria varia]|nr:HHLA1 protein [Grallaria varia]
IMQWLCWHVAAKMSLGFLCLFLVFNTESQTKSCLVSQQEKLFLSLFLHFSASCIRRESKKEKQVAVLATAELPAKSLDLAAINLTELVNSMLSSALRGTKKLFSLLSVTSYSSFAFHKVSVTIYNISNVKNVDPGKFSMHYCYCLNNVTNDLTDFTALLVDIIGNSTSYLTEIFKSTSILSVRQSNDSDCIYICVMTGQTGENLSDFWEILEKSPVINYTFSSNTSSDLDSIFSSSVKLQEDPSKTLDPSAERVGAVQTSQCAGALPLVSLVSPATSIPLAQKGEEIPTTRFPPWPKTAGAKGSRFPSPHVEASRPQGIGGPPPAPGRGSDPWPALQPSPEHQGSHQLPGSIQATLGSSFWVYLKAENPSSDLDSLQMSQFLIIFGLLTSPGSWMNSNTTLVVCEGGFFEGVNIRDSERKALSQISSLSVTGNNSTVGCPQAILREPPATSPPVTLIVQKINPCVMELCRFFQLCLCVGQRKYSRKEAMRYCVEYYSWFVKNASYVCERVKRVAYSHTLKQKCLKNICTSV